MNIKYRYFKVNVRVNDIDNANSFISPTAPPCDDLLIKVGTRTRFTKLRLATPSAQTPQPPFGGHSLARTSYVIAIRSVIISVKHTNGNISVVPSTTCINVNQAIISIL